VTVGIVGLGNMGGRIARRLVDGGEEVVGFDLDAARAADAGGVRINDQTREAI
jgi:3-hydroxyisobutyrate dehydrogenase